MEIARKIVAADTLTPIIDLPWKSKNMQVEVIVVPWNETPKSGVMLRKSSKGCLKAYANPSLWEEEQSAWKNTIVEKYGAA